MEGPQRVSDAVAPLLSGLGLDLLLREDGFVLRSDAAGPVVAIDAGEVMAGDEANPAVSHDLLDKSLGSLGLHFIHGDGSYRTGFVRATIDGARADIEPELALPLVLDAAAAERLAAGHLARANIARRRARLRLPFTKGEAEPGDGLELENDTRWRVSRAEEGLVRALGLEVQPETALGDRATGQGGHSDPAIPTERVELVVIPAPFGPGLEDRRPLVGAYGRPFPNGVEVWAGSAPERLSLRADLSAPILLGLTETAFEPGVTGRWDRAATLKVNFNGEVLASVSRLAALEGALTLAIEGPGGWEWVSVREAGVGSDGRMMVSDLLRGLAGSEALAGRSVPSGARVVVITGALVRAEVSEETFARPLVWETRAGRTVVRTGPVAADRATGLLRPGHLRAVTDGAGGLALTWRGRDVSLGSGLEGPKAVALSAGVRYRVTVTGGSGDWSGETGLEQLSVSGADFASLGAGLLEVTVRVVGADGVEGEAVSTMA